MSLGIYDMGDVYDAIYSGRGKDYRAEAEVVTKHIRARHPDASTLLDVGCGTGRHLVTFASEFSHVEGIDLAEGMLAVARRELPDVLLQNRDMRSFRLDRRFDAIVSLFSAVGNLSTVDDLNRTLACFAEHLAPGGVVVIEPWWFPENFTAGHVGASVTDNGITTVSRVSHATLHSPVASRMEVHYVIAESGKGIEHFSDEHIMALYTRDQYESAFTGAGLSVEHVDEYDGNGLFIGVKEGR